MEVFQERRDEAVTGLFPSANQIAPTPDHDREEGPQLQNYWHVLTKRKWLIAASLVVVVGLTALWTFSQTKIYRATATLLIGRNAPQVLGSEMREVVEMGEERGYRNREYLETEQLIITSRQIATRVAEKQRLDADAKFWPVGTPASKRTLQAAASYLRRLITAIPEKESDVVKVSADHPNPEVAAKIANAVAGSYMDFKLEYKLASATHATQWLAEQLDDVKKQLENAELALYQFKKDNNVISMSMEDKQSILSNQIVQLSSAVTDAQVELINLASLRSQLDQARKQDPFEVALPQIIESHTIQEMKVAYESEQRAYVALRQRYGEKWPAVRESKAKLDALRGEVEREVHQVLASLESRYQQIAEKRHQLEGALQKSKNEALELNHKSVTYQRLERTQTNAEKLYRVLLTRMKESDLSSQLRVSNVRLLDAAVTPMAPSKPNVQINFVLGIVLGLLAGIGGALVAEGFDRSVKAQRDVSEIPGLNFLGVIPRIPGTEPLKGGKRAKPNPELDLIVHRSPKSLVAESCRNIRTNLLFASTDEALNTMVITSPGPREGKTTTAASMAITMSQAGNRVLLVDTDMRRPRLHRLFGVPGSEGLTSVLLGDASIDSVIKATEVPNLSVLPCGPVPPNPAELCQSERFKQLLRALNERFDRVLLDSPPVMAVTDSVILSTIADGTLIVARTGHTSRSVLRAVTKQVLDVNGRLLGCILNDMDITKGSYGYYRYRRYGYYRYGYGRYYGDEEEKAAVS